MKRLHLACILALLPFAAGKPAKASTIVFSDHDFPDANWTIPDSLFLDPAQTGQRLAGGNPGAYRQLGLIFAERPDYAVNLNVKFVYAPATEGPITGITYNFDLKVINAFGSSYYPLVSQGGVLFYDPFAQAYNSENLWINYNFVLNLGQFVPLHGGSATPNFATGSAITFGYLATTGGAGFYESITGIDNDPITLKVSPLTSATPEPATLTLFGSGLLSLAGLCRSRRAKSGRTPRQNGAMAYSEVVTAEAAPPSTPGLLQVLMKPWLDRMIAIVASAPFLYTMYYRLHLYGPSLPVLAFATNASLLILTLVIRRPPKRITPNSWYWLLAFVATYWSFMILGAMQRGHPLASSRVTDALAICAFLITVWARLSLGRNIGFVPAQREIVTDGAYRYVRHPIYSGAFAGMVALALRNYTPRNTLLLGLGMLWFMIKSVVEENFLREDPQYASYLRRVRARWVPFLV